MKLSQTLTKQFLNFLNFFQSQPFDRRMVLLNSFYSFVCPYNDSLSFIRCSVNFIIIRSLTSETPLELLSFPPERKNPLKIHQGKLICMKFKLPTNCFSQIMELGTNLAYFKVKIYHLSFSIQQTQTVSLPVKCRGISHLISATAVKRSQGEQILDNRFLFQFLIINVEFKLYYQGTSSRGQIYILLFFDSHIHTFNVQHSKNTTLRFFLDL